MVWGVISGYGAGPLVRVKSNQISEKYCETLETHLIQWVIEIFGNNCRGSFSKAMKPATYRVILRNGSRNRVHTPYNEPPVQRT